MHRHTHTHIICTCKLLRFKEKRRPASWTTVKICFGETRRRCRCCSNCLNPLCERGIRFARTISSSSFLFWVWYGLWNYFSFYFWKCFVKTFLILKEDGNPEIGAFALSWIMDEFSRKTERKIREKVEDQDEFFFFWQINYNMYCVIQLDDSAKIILIHCTNCNRLTGVVSWPSYRPIVNTH